MAQATSAVWQSLLEMSGTLAEYRFTINGTEYSSDAEISHEVTNELFEEFGIGGANCAMLNLEIIADNIPRGAEIKRAVRLVNGDTVSEWLPKGTFYTNRRICDGDYWRIEAYDAMRKADSDYLPDTITDDWPKPMAEAVAEIAAAMGIEIDPRTEIDPSYMLAMPVGYTKRQVLAHIAAAHGGNWIISDTGKLYLVPLLSFTQTLQHFVGLDVVDFEDMGKHQPVSRVTLFIDDEQSYTAGDDTGKEVSAFCPSASQEIVNTLLQNFEGFVYQSYIATAVNIDPAVELGDGIYVGEIQSVVAQIVDKGNSYPDVSAPGAAELEDEYPSAGFIEKELKRRSREIKTEIKTALGTLTLTVTNGETSSTITLKLNGVEIASQEITFDGYVTFEGLENGETVIDGGCIKADSEIKSPKIIGGKIYAGNIDEPDGYTVMTETGLEVHNSEGDVKIRLGYTSDGYDFPFVELGSGSGNSASKGLVKKFTDGLWVGNSAAAEANGTFSPTANYNGMFFSFVTGKAYVVQGQNMQNIYTGEAIARFG